MRFEPRIVVRLIIVLINKHALVFKFKAMGGNPNLSVEIISFLGMRATHQHRLRYSPHSAEFTKRIFSLNLPSRSPYKLQSSLSTAAVYWLSYLEKCWFAILMFKLKNKQTQKKAPKTNFHSEYKRRKSPSNNRFATRWFGQKSVDNFLQLQCEVIFSQSHCIHLPIRWTSASPNIVSCHDKGWRRCSLSLWCSFVSSKPSSIFGLNM